MFTEAFFINLTWCITILALTSLIGILIYFYCLHNELEWLIRHDLDKAEFYVKYLRSEQEKETQED